jgi:hypothetical protein
MSPPFSGISKVRKSYQISVWNAETQQLMHTISWRVTIMVVQVGVKIYVAVVEEVHGNQEKGTMG